MARNTEKREKWEMHILGPVIWRKNCKRWKIRNAHCRTWNMVRKLKNVENETQIMYDLAYGKKHSKTWNMRNHTEGPGVWQEK